MSAYLFGRLLPYRGIRPTIATEVFIAPGCFVIGDVSIAARASLWYNVVARGDVNTITIGAESNIQDGAILHVDSDNGALRIGERVTVGHQAILHACTLQDECLIGMGATILDQALVERHVLVAAGAVVRPREHLASGSLYAGVPARRVRDLTAEEIAHFARSAAHYVEYAGDHARAVAQEASAES